MKKIITVTTALTFLFGAYAMADMHEQDDHHPPMEGHRGKNHMFINMDKDNDGIITKKEFLAASEEHFKRMDANHDGKITKEEIQQRHEEMKKKFKDRKDRRNHRDDDDDMPEKDSE